MSLFLQSFTRKNNVGILQRLTILTVDNTLSLHIVCSVNELLDKIQLLILMYINCVFAGRFNTYRYIFIKIIKNSTRLRSERKKV